MNIERNQYNLILAVPALLIYGLFFLLPALVSVFLSFTDWSNLTTGFSSLNFVGLQNLQLLFEDDSFKAAFLNTTLFTAVTTVTKVGLGLFLAIILNNRFKTTNFLRTVFFFPAVLSIIVVGLIFSAVLKPDGPLNQLIQLSGMGFLAQDWLADRNLALWSVMAVETWKWSGLSMMIFIAGLQSISHDYYEAATIDGAGSFRKFVNITFPLIMPSITINVVNNLIGGLKIFDIVFVLTNGGPGNASQVLSGFVFSKFGGGAYGLGTAATLFQTLIVTLVAVASATVLKNREVEL